MIFPDLNGLMILIAALTVMFLLVSRQRIKEFRMYGLIGGLLVAFSLVLIMQNLFQFWIFSQLVDFFMPFGIPFFLSSAWFPVIILFCHLITSYEHLLTKLGILFAFPLGAVIVQYLLIINGMLVYNNWNLVLTFIVSLGIHLGISFALYLKGKLDTSLPA